MTELSSRKFLGKLLKQYSMLNLVDWLKGLTWSRIQGKIDSEKLLSSLSYISTNF